MQNFSDDPWVIIPYCVLHNFSTSFFRRVNWAVLLFLLKVLKQPQANSFASPSEPHCCSNHITNSRDGNHQVHATTQVPVPLAAGSQSAQQQEARIKSRARTWTRALWWGMWGYQLVSNCCLHSKEPIMRSRKFYFIPSQFPHRLRAEEMPSATHSCYGDESE